jgi:hypothetical protein
MESSGFVAMVAGGFGLGLLAEMVTGENIFRGNGP